MVCVATAFCVSAAPQKVNFDKLPKNSQEFIQQHFAMQKVKSVEMDREASWDKYTVYFDSGSQVSFEGGSGDWSQIIMKDGSVPAAVIPAKIRSYATATYPNLHVVMIETTTDGYKLKLSDNSFLDFDKDGQFTKASK